MWEEKRKMQSMLCPILWDLVDIMQFFVSKNGQENKRIL
jgi:hypothetical protein